ncbi:MAG: hypothetical protein J5817_04450 [Treponema sp.]|nr:hypothetical protein [Treponema sp.]
MKLKTLIFIAVLIFSSGFLFAEEVDASFSLNLNLYAFDVNGERFDEDDNPSGINMDINGCFDVTPYFYIGGIIGLPFWFWDFLTTDSETYEKKDITVNPSDKIFTFSLTSGLDYNLLDVIRLEAYVEAGFISNSWAAGAGASASLLLIGTGDSTSVGLRADYGYYYGYSVEVHEWTPFQKFALGIVMKSAF